MQTMYDVVARELKSMQLADSHPQDYLNFYCLANREKIPDNVSNANGDKVTVQEKIPYTLLQACHALTAFIF